MRLCSQLNRQVGDKEYRKWYVIVSSADVEKLKWAKGQELVSKVHGSKLTLEPAQSPRS